MYWYQGKLYKQTSLSIEINDPGLLYGATIFTTLRVYEQSLAHPLTHWSSHRKRLENSLKTLNWSNPNWELLYQGAAILARDYPVLRITIFPDGRELIIARSLPQNLHQWQQQGITATVTPHSPYYRYLPAHKTGNYLGPWLATQKAENLGAQTAILTDSQGNWLETCTGNLWGYTANCWYVTPMTNDLLPGIMQQHLMEWLKTQGITVIAKTWSLDWVEQLEAIAYTNSVFEVIPFRQIDTETGIIKLNPQLPAFADLKAYFSRKKR